jgi:hypothetical protein
MPRGDRKIRISVQIAPAERAMYRQTCELLGLTRAEFLRAAARLLVSKARRAAREDPGSEDAAVLGVMVE